MKSFKVALALIACLILTQVSSFACSAHQGGETVSHTDGDKPANG